MRWLLATAPGADALLSAKATARLIRIDVNGLELAAGQTAVFVISVDGVERRHSIVCDDPAPEKGLSFSLPAEAEAGQTFTVTAEGADICRTVFANAQYFACYSSTRWLDYLPAVFKEEAAQETFLSHYLAQLFSDGEGIEARLDEIASLVVPGRLPCFDAARYLAGWFNIDLDLTLPEGFWNDAPRLDRARRFLARVLPEALSGGTAKSVECWVEAVAEARGMRPERRRRIKLIEGYTMRRFFTLRASQEQGLPEMTKFGENFGRLGQDPPLANDPLAHRAILGHARLRDKPSLGTPEEVGDPVLLQRLLGARLWLVLPEREGFEPAPEDWPALLAPILPAHLYLIPIMEPGDDTHAGRAAIPGAVTVPDDCERRDAT